MTLMSSGDPLKIRSHGVPSHGSRPRANLPGGEARRESSWHKDSSRVAINALFLDHPRTGTGVYTREMLGRLVTIEPSRYTLLGHPEHAAAWRNRHADRGDRYIGLQAPLRSREARLEKALWEQLFLPAAVERLGAPLLYAPYLSLPLGTRARTVVTVHDLVPLLLADYAPSPLFTAYFSLVCRAVRRADAVITDSAYSAADITRVLGVPSRRIHVIPLGVEPAYLAPVDPHVLVGLRDRLGLPERFVLYLGGTDPRKNIVTLLRAQAQAQASEGSVLPLVVVAPTRARTIAGWEAHEPRGEVERLGLGGDEVIVLDWIREEDKPALYAAATAFVYPSRYEGFGLPPLEAMAVGTPVISSNGSSLPEVVGDAGLMLDPDDLAGWSDALCRVSHDEEWLRDLAERGRRRARTFSWDAAASSLHDLLALVADGGHPA